MRESDFRKEIKKQVKGYFKEYHKPVRFVPGKTRIPYAGRVYDHREMCLAVESVLDFWLSSGRFSESLEEKLKKFMVSRDFMLVNSGSSANLLMVASLCSDNYKKRLKPGDEVITPAVTFPTTLGPLVQHGLIPVFADVEPATYNINADLIEKAAGKKTRAIFIPHTLGNPCDMDIVMRVAKKKNLLVLEDSCDALGSLYGGKPVGSYGCMSSFSFYPAHHMTMGEGGGIAINDESLRRIARSIRDWGRDCYCGTGQSNSCGRRFSIKKGDLPFGYDHKYVYSNIGYNLKVTEMQSAVGIEQFKKMSSFTEARKNNFIRYYRGLSVLSDRLIMPERHGKSDPSWFGFPITVREGVDRLALIKFLEDSKIETRLIFGGNIIRQPAFKNIKHRISGKLKHSDFVMNNSFFIGVYPGLTREMIDYVLSRFRTFFKK